MPFNVVRDDVNIDWNLHPYIIQAKDTKLWNHGACPRYQPCWLRGKSATSPPQDVGYQYIIAQGCRKSHPRPQLVGHLSLPIKL